MPAALIGRCLANTTHQTNACSRVFIKQHTRAPL